MTIPQPHTHDTREIEAHTGAITDLFREAEKLLAGVAKQQGDESDSELKVCMRARD